VLFSWYYRPFLADQFQPPTVSLSAIVFDLRGVAFAAWTLAAFALGVLIGMLIRRVVPAIAATLATYAGLALVVGLFLRQHYMTPFTVRNVTPDSSAWIISQWWTKGGPPVNGTTLAQVLNQGPPQLSGGKGGIPQSATVNQYIQHGYTWTTYQPGSRFWPFQWIEGGWLLALSVLLIAVTVGLVRRRAT
jgi:hypothetical protein